MPAIRAPLMLQAVLGLDAAPIASAFLMSPAAMGQRLVRAKTKIRQAGIPLKIPEREELPARLETVLDAIYAAFSEGWLTPSEQTRCGATWLKKPSIFVASSRRCFPGTGSPGLAGVDALCRSSPQSPPRPRGSYIALAEQDISLWDCDRIAEAESTLLRASEMSVIGRYQLEAAIQSAHVSRRRTGADNWSAVVKLYDALLALHRFAGGRHQSRRRAR